MVRHQWIVALGMAFVMGPVVAAVSDPFEKPVPTISSYVAYHKDAPWWAPYRGLYVAANAIGAHYGPAEVEDQSTGGITPLTSTDLNARKLVAGGAVAIGYSWWRRYGVPLRVEVAYSQRKVSFNDILDYPGNPIKLNGEITSRLLMGNLYWDWHFSSDTRFVPYADVGIGQTFNKTEGVSTLASTSTASSKSTNKIAFGAGLGARYAATEHVLLNLGYRYLHLGSAEWGTLATSNSDIFTIDARRINSHEVNFGIAFRF